jgi:hypothetical protein
VTSRGNWFEWPFDPLPVLRGLNDHGVEYVLIGGLAAILQGSPLPTYDIDITLPANASNLNRFQTALDQLEAVILGDAQALNEGKIASFSTRYGYVDAIATPTGLGSYTSLRRDARRVALEPGLNVLCSSLRDILRLRIATGDLRQIPALEAVLELSGGKPRTP